MVKGYFKNILKNNPLVLPAVFLAGIFYSGLVCIDCESSYSSLVCKNDVSRVCGTVVSTPVRLEGASSVYRFKVRLNSVLDKNGMFCKASGEVDVLMPSGLYEIHSPGRLYSYWRGKKQDFLIDCGAQVELSVVSKSKKDLKTGGARTEFNVSSVMHCDWEDGFFANIKRIRALSRLHFTRLMYAWGEAGGLILALLSGSREYVLGEVRNSFRDAGLSHILALSGTHLSLFSGLAFFLGRKSFGKKAAHVLELVAILLFFWFAGKSPSLFRALLCSLCLVGGAAFHIKIKSLLNVLALCFLIHIAIFPADMHELAFMLSYGALAGIFCFNEFIAKPLSRALPCVAGSSLGQSIGAQVFNVPVCIKFFNMVTPGGIIASAVVSPFTVMYIYMALAFIVVSLVFPFFAPVCGCVLSAFYSVLTKCVFWFAKIPCIQVE